MEDIEIPILNLSNDRKNSIVNNSPAIFQISPNHDADGSSPWYEFESQSEVCKWWALIIELSKRHKIDAHLIMSILHMETTYGWYDEYYPFNKTVRPMNLHYSYWRKLGITKELLGCPYYNIEFGVILLSRIQARIENPTVAKIASIYNFLGSEKVNNYGARVAKIYQQRPWTRQGCGI